MVDPSTYYIPSVCRMYTHKDSDGVSKRKLNVGKEVKVRYIESIITVRKRSKSSPVHHTTSKGRVKSSLFP